MAQIVVAVSRGKKAGAPFPHIDAVLDHMVVEQVAGAYKAEQGRKILNRDPALFFIENGIQPRHKLVGALVQAFLQTWPCGRSEEHTSELQSLMRTPYAV